MPQQLTFEATDRLIRTPDYRIQINEAGTGHPIIMIHGTGPGATGWSNFAPTMTGLSDRYRCIAVTMPGWGASSPQDLATGRDQGAAIVQLMDALGIERAAFVGNSMGGGVGMIMATKHPDRVSHLITMGSGVWGPAVVGPTGMSEGMQALFDAYEDPTPARFKRLVSVMCFDPSFATDELAAERAAAAAANPAHLRNWLDLMRAGRGADGFAEAGRLLPATRVPTLLVHGRDDRTVHFELSLRTLALVPRARLVLLNQCGHWAQLEHAETFNHLVHDFVSQN
ncbi:alpha/beta hydrolase [Nocardioides sp. QY071]|uniref:alpha/beta fold hydrolase n=1 Tax=Nocardioides sp. QY071 TaxID=3044187 RepID=UPI00249B2DFF|nr:alpha/beta hydrolase [Nocardioides sp. QY071]WGY00411.1 alpha/beta hydrolase [Nocardioides sp. QY071]